MRLGHSAFQAEISLMSHRQELMLNASALVASRLSSSIRTSMPTLSARHHISSGDSKAWVKMVLGTAVGARVRVGAGAAVAGTAVGAAVGAGLSLLAAPVS